jgi:eukaryotic-like serine/threonine-protein kinase
MTAPKKFKFLKKLSDEGNFWKVDLYENLYLKRNEAIKTIKINLEESWDNLTVIDKSIFESSTLQYLKKSPYIVDIYDAQIVWEEFKIHMEYIENGSLSSYLKWNIFLTTSQIIKIAECILQWLEHAHNKWILHLDIKPWNILVKNENVYKLWDFWQSVNTESNKIKEIYTWHCPPEILSWDTEKPTFQSDIYMFWVTMFRLLNWEEYFFRKLNELKLKKKLRKSIISWKFPDRDKYLPYVPKKLKKIVNKCLNIDLSKRYLSIREVRQDIWRLKLNYFWEVKDISEDLIHFLCKNSSHLSLELIAEKKINSWNISLKKFTKKTKIQIKKHCKKNLNDVEVREQIAKIFDEYF